MLRIFKTKYFCKWAEAHKIENDSLRKATDELCHGNTDGDLGGFLHKKRVARHGQGKSKGYRTIIAFKIDEKAFFVYGFAKNELENIDTKTLKAFKQLAKDFMGMNSAQIELALSNKELFEVDNHDKK